MKRTPLALAAAAALPLLVACEQQSEGGYSIGSEENVIMRINGKSVPEARLAAYAPQGVTLDEALLEQLSENIIASELLSAKALEEGLQNQPEIREQIEVARQNVLGRAVVNRLIEENPVTDEAIEAQYAQLVSQIEGGNEFNARHILVETEEEANEIVEQIGEDLSLFSDIAREKSIDPGSGQNGGELGWSSPDAYVPEFSEALQALEIGEFTREPVESQFGWHVILVDDIREVAVPELDDEIRTQLQSALQNQVIGQYIDDLRTKAEIIRI